MTDTNRMTIVLGDEFDDALRTKLLNVLRGLGAFVAGSEGRAIVGSQDLEELDVLIDGQVLHVEAETYVGLSICGPAELVKKIQRVMAA
jgi:hypothetical protein